MPRLKERPVKGGNAPNHLVITGPNYCTGNMGDQRSVDERNRKIAADRKKQKELELLPKFSEGYVLLTHAARILGISMSVVRKACMRGKIPYVKVDRRFLIKEDDLRNYFGRKVWQ